MQEQLSKVKSELLVSTTASTKAQEQAQRIQVSLTTQLEDTERSLQSLQESSSLAAAEHTEKIHLLEGIVEECGQEIIKLETEGKCPACVSYVLCVLVLCALCVAYLNPSFSPLLSGPPH